LTDVSIRIDAETARLVAELAHLMQRTKKSVMADAIAGYSHARLPELGNGRLRYSELTPRERLRLRRDELLRAFEERGTTNVRVLDPPMPARAANVVPTDEDASDDVRDPRDPRDVRDPRDLRDLRDVRDVRDVESIHVDDAPTSTDTSGTDDAFGDLVVGGAAFASHRETITLLAETDLIFGGGAESMMEDLARQVLGMRVEVISMTKLALFNPERLERLVGESTPL
jgi:hypothetical protein